MWNQVLVQARHPGIGRTDNRRGKTDNGCTKGNRRTGRIDLSRRANGGGAWVDGPVRGGQPDRRRTSSGAVTVASGQSLASGRRAGASTGVRQPSRGGRRLGGGIDSAVDCRVPRRPGIAGVDSLDASATCQRRNPRWYLRGLDSAGRKRPARRPECHHPLDLGQGIRRTLPGNQAQGRYPHRR